MGAFCMVGLAIWGFTAVSTKHVGHNASAADILISGLHCDTQQNDISAAIGEFA